MKRNLILLLAIILMFSMVGCKKEESPVDLETGEGAGAAVAGTVISGAIMYNDAKDVVEQATTSIDAMMKDTTNSMLKVYEGEKVRGTTVQSFISKVKDVNEDKILPIDFSIVYEDELSETAIVTNAYYVVKISDTLPEGNLDGIYDLATVSKWSTEVVSGE